MADEQSSGNYQSGEPTKRYGYGKRPLWQWIVLYLLIGGIAYAVIYYVFFTKGSGYSYKGSQYQANYPSQNTNSQNQSTNNQTTTQTNQGNSYMIQNMKVDILKEGTGAGAKSGDTVSVNYVGTLQNGTKF